MPIQRRVQLARKAESAEPRLLEPQEPGRKIGELRACCSGVPFALAAPTDLLRAVRSCLPPGSTVGVRHQADVRFALHRGAGGVFLVADDRNRTVAANLKSALDQLEDRIRFEVACRSREHLFVHAGVVGIAGRALVIPARSGSGKSHLVAALVRAGAHYYSDEFALIDDRGRIHPYAQRLALGEVGGGPKRRIDPTTLGGRVGCDPLPLARVLVTRFEPGVAFEPETLSPAETVLELFSHVVRARAAPRQALARLERAVADADGLRSLRAEAKPLASRLIQELSEPQS